jgi:hypothetical protein
VPRSRRCSAPSSGPWSLTSSAYPRAGGSVACAVQDQLRELDFRGKATPIVQRLRYLEQHGEHPGEYPNPWQGFQTEMEQIDERLLQPTRQTLERAGQGYLCDQIAVTGDNLGPGALSVELDRLLGVVEGRQNGDANSVPFRFGRRAAHRE